MSGQADNTMFTTSDPTVVSSKGIEQGGGVPEERSPDFSWAVPALQSENLPPFARLNEVKINGRQGVIANVGQDKLTEKLKSDLSTLRSEIPSKELPIAQPTVIEQLDTPVKSLSEQLAKTELRTKESILEEVAQYTTRQVKQAQHQGTSVAAQELRQIPNSSILDRAIQAGQAFIDRLANKPANAQPKVTDFAAAAKLREAKRHQLSQAA